jgi:hypothetical protein
MQHGQPTANAAPGTQCRNIDGKGLIIAIHNQSAQAISVGVDHSVGVRIGIELEGVFTETDGPQKQCIQVSFGKFAFAMVQHAQWHSGFRIEVTSAKAAAFFVINIHQIARSRVT